MVDGLPSVERVLPQRTYPAKGARVGVRWLNPCGTPSKRHGFPRMPGIVEQLTARFFSVRHPRTGLASALDLYDAWEVEPADELVFWKFCPACRGTGDVYQWKDPIDPAKDVVVSCVECAGWGEIGTHPFRVSRREKPPVAAAQHERADEATTPYRKAS
jgi:hypothetical protein